MRKLLLILMLMPVVGWGQKRFDSFWGMKMFDTKEQVIDKAFKTKRVKPKHNSDGLLSFVNVTFAGMDAEMIFKFSDNKLTRAGASFTFGSTAKLLSNYHNMVSDIEKKYDKPYKQVERLPSHLSSESEYYSLTGRAFDNGEAMYQTRWRLKDENNRDILMVLQIKDAESMVLLCADEKSVEKEEEEKVNNSDY